MENDRGGFWPKDITPRLAGEPACRLSSAGCPVGRHKHAAAKRNVDPSDQHVFRYNVTHPGSLKKAHDDLPRLAGHQADPLVMRPRAGSASFHKSTCQCCTYQAAKPLFGLPVSLAMHSRQPKERCHQLSGAWANHTWTQTSGRLPLLWRHLPPFLPISSRMECYDMLASCAIPLFFGTTIFGHHNNPHSQRNLSQGLSCESSPLHPGGQVMSLFGKPLPFLSVSDLWGRSPPGINPPHISQDARFWTCFFLPKSQESPS